MTASYFLYFALPAFAVVAIVSMAGTRMPAGLLVRHLVPVLLVTALILAAIAKAYYVVRQQAGHQRTAQEIDSQSADVADYLHSAPHLRLWGHLGTTGGEHELFPGVLAVALASIALVTQRRSTWVLAYATMCGLAFILSLGPHPTA